MVQYDKILTTFVHLQSTPVNNKGFKKKKINEKTPLLDSTNQSLRSGNRSLRSIGKTPMSLKKVMTRAFRRNKEKYDVKTGKKKVVVTPKKKLNL